MVNPQEVAFLTEVSGTPRSKFAALDIPDPENGPWIIVMKSVSLAYTKVTIIDRNPVEYLENEQSRFPLNLKLVTSLAIDPVRATYWHTRLKSTLFAYRTETASTWYTFSEATLLALVNTLNVEVAEDNTRIARIRAHYRTRMGMSEPAQVVPATATFPDGLSLLERAIGWLANGDYAAFDAYREADKDTFWEGYSHFKVLRETQPETWRRICRSFFNNPAYLSWQRRNADRLRNPAPR